MSMFCVSSSNPSVRKYLPAAACLAGTIVFFPHVDTVKLDGSFADCAGSGDPLTDFSEAARGAAGVHYHYGPASFRI